MPLSNPRFLNEPILEACLDGKQRLTLGAKGPHVKKVQQALLDLGLKLPVFGADGSYGRETAEAVFKFKEARGLRNDGGTIDGIVGPKTMDRLDKDAPRSAGGGPGGGGGAVAPNKQDIIKSAFDRSRATLRVVLAILQRLEGDIERADSAQGNQKIVAIQALGRNHARNIAVLSLRLKVSQNPLSSEFRAALRKARDLIQGNLSASSKIVDQGDAGRCTASNFDPPGVPHGATNRTDPDPRVSVCTPFFSDNADLQRDVITHEFFHLLGLADISVANTNNALNNANTMAQVVAFLHDRLRQKNSDGQEPAVPPLPMP